MLLSIMTTNQPAETTNQPAIKKERPKDTRYLFQRPGGSYFFEMRKGGKRYNEPMKARTLTEARIERSALLTKYSKSQDDVQPERHKTVTVSELAADYVTHIRNRGKVSADDIERTLNIVCNHKVYKDRLAWTITTDDNTEFQNAMIKGDYAPATCDNLLAFLRAAFIHGSKRQTPRKVLFVPYFPMFNPKNARMGFIEWQQYENMRIEFSDSLLPLFVMGYHSGCRKEKLLLLRWSQVHFDGGYVEFDPGASNKGTGLLPFYGDVEATLLKQLAIRNAECPDCEYVFFWHEKDALEPNTRKQTFKTGRRLRKLAGSRIHDINKEWIATVKRAGYDGLLFHDLRRSAVSNMIQHLDTTESEAMAITGHKTTGMLQRYNIRSAKSVKLTGAKMNAKLKELRAGQEQPQQAA
jgi:integrase